jgi:hypothetical protein
LYWTPPLAAPSIERSLLQFENELRKEIKQRKHCRSRILRSRMDLHFSNSDKNVGPVVRTKRKHMENMVKDHLISDAYKRLTNEKADLFNQETCSEIRKVMHQRCGTKKPIITYFHRSIKKHNRDAHTYGLAKLHSMTLWPTNQS